MGTLGGLAVIVVVNVKLLPGVDLEGEIDRSLILIAGCLEYSPNGSLILVSN